MDFIIRLPSSKGYTVVFIIVDHLSKYTHFHVLPTSFTATKVVDVLVNMVCRLHGIPKAIVFYCDPTFLSNF